MLSSTMSQMTPQPKLPGVFVQTPAPQRSGSQMTLFRSTSVSALGQRVDTPHQHSRQLAPSLGNKSNETNGQPTHPEELSPVARAARTINQTMAAEARYPELEGYLGQGYSADYSLPDDPAWMPFQRVRNYDIPDQIFEQADISTLNTKLGLFAELQHAYMIIDNSLYLWDYTHPNPELTGYEESTHAITTAALVKPRTGVFVNQVTHLLLVATTADIILIGLAANKTPQGSTTVALYNTRMSVGIRGLGCDHIVASAKTGRIFFSSGTDSNDIWELTYQQQERWFKSRCDKVNHTAQTVALPVSFNFFASKTEPEHVRDLKIDDSRDLLYALSSRSTIRVFHIKPNGELTLALERTFAQLLANIGHMIPRSDILGPTTSIVAINPITAKESARLSLQALTSTGCRIFLSATSGSFYARSDSVPSSMQVHHVKFPPRNPNIPQQPQQNTSGQPAQYGMTAAAPLIDVSSQWLVPTANGTRYAPGFNLWVVKNPQDHTKERLFLSAPDPGRINIPKDASQATKYPENAQWLDSPHGTQDFGLASPSFAAASTPQGFANEMSVQYDATSTEIAILSSTGIQIIRRRRLVDVFAAAIRSCGDTDGRRLEAKKFARLYGFPETAATALAVACGQGSDVTPDERIAQITEPDVIEFARESFIQYGGKPTLNENSVVDNTASIDNVRTSPRHEGLSLYIARLVRSTWNSRILLESRTPQGGVQVQPFVPLAKLQNVQRSLNALQEFLTKNRSSIEGLAGPEALGRISTKQEEVALQGEHRAMHALVQLISSMVQCIAFVLVLFDERVEDIIMSLPPQSQQRLRQLTFEGLFTSAEGRDLAKELVKAIVNRNISNGSNVDTVAEALRRKCGSICSADDVVIFKAQEQVKRSSESGVNSEQGRALLNESLRLFQKVASSLSQEHLEWAVEHYIQLEFYAGAIHLSLSVAQDMDRANRALSWLREDCPENDARKIMFDKRSRCYALIHQVISAVDEAADHATDRQDGHETALSKRRSEAYNVINNSDDEVFQNTLFDWYVSQGWSDRLLDISSPFVVSYLRRRMEKDPAHADLLWRYHAHHDNFLEAASVQLLLAKSSFDISLEDRIAYLSRARTNASIRTTLLLDSRQTRHQLLREISDLVDVAGVQDEILQRIRTDPRLTDERRPAVTSQLDGKILDVDKLFNTYAEPALYHDICIMIYQVADHRNAADIQSTWEALIQQIHQRTESAGDLHPYQAVTREVKEVGSRLRLAEATFPVPILVPILERYALEYQRGIGPEYWVVDTFLDIDVPHKAIVPALEQLYYANEQPFQGKNRRILANALVYVIKHWFTASQRSGGGSAERGGGVLFGSEDNLAGVEEVLGNLLRSSDLVGEMTSEAEELRVRIAQAMR